MMSMDATTEPVKQELRLNLESEPGDCRAIQHGLTLLKASWGRHFNRRMKLLTAAHLEALSEQPELAASR